MMNVTQVIEAFGGYEKARRLFGVSRSLLAEWEVSGIPSKRWTQLVELATDLKVGGISLQSLAEAAPSKVKTERASAETGPGVAA